MDDADWTESPANPGAALPPVEPGRKRIFAARCEAQLPRRSARRSSRSSSQVTPPGCEPFTLDRSGGDDPEGCLMPLVRIIEEGPAGEDVYGEYVVAVHEM